MLSPEMSAERPWWQALPQKRGQKGTQGIVGGVLSQLCHCEPCLTFLVEGDMDGHLLEALYKNMDLTELLLT